jgi:hypothetical protein
MFRVVKTMPPLWHFPPNGQPFDVMKSEVVQWMLKQPEIAQTVFNMAKRHGMIVYDLESKTWRGIRWRG